MLDQAVSFMLKRPAADGFHPFCSDNKMTRAMDEGSIEEAVGDIIKNRRGLGP